MLCTHWVRPNYACPLFTTSTLDIIIHTCRNLQRHQCITLTILFTYYYREKCATSSRVTHNHVIGKIFMQYNVQSIGKIFHLHAKIIIIIKAQSKRIANNIIVVITVFLIFFNFSSSFQDLESLQFLIHVQGRLLAITVVFSRSVIDSVAIKLEGWLDGSSTQLVVIQ